MHIQLQNIHKHFGDVKANDGITLEFEPGKIYGVLGENGAGKTTLMKVLSGYHKPDHGTIVIDWTDRSFFSPADALAAGIGMIYQDPLDVPSMRTVENYVLGRSGALAVDLGKAEEELTAFASTVGFEVNPRAYIDTLSLGERQQLELIRLLSLGADLLILDEPTTGISADQKEQLFNSLQKLAGKDGKIIILVSHKLSEVQELCDEVYVLRRGRKVGGVTLPATKQSLVSLMFEELPKRTERASYIREHTIMQLQDLQLSDGRILVGPLNLELHAGEVLGLAGLEGSGQQLLLRACAGLVEAESGKIIIEERDMTRFGYHKRREEGVAYMPSGRLEEGLVEGLSLTDHFVLAEPQHGFVIQRERYQQLTEERIDEYQIVGQSTSRVEELSGGNQQRALLALLRKSARLILLEHPTRGLDVRSAEWIWQVLFQRAAEGAGIIFFSADLDEIIERSDRIAAFSGGQMSRIVTADQTTTDELGHMIGGEL
ncbi:MAG: ATP-binding cassette domain-containing protein [Anaerolineales bacterium]|nr:ATP-binding cassette domain-containing protein [Anaerolineales bacterium]